MWRATISKPIIKALALTPIKRSTFPKAVTSWPGSLPPANPSFLRDKKGDRPGLAGAGTIWGVGQPVGEVVSIAGQEVNGRIYTLAVPVRITMALRDRNRGIPAPRVREILGRPLGFTGGLWKLEPKQFFLLLRELEERIAREELLGIKLTEWKRETAQGRFSS